MTLLFSFEMTVPYPVFMKMCASSDILISAARIYYRDMPDDRGSMLVSGMGALEALTFYMGCPDFLTHMVSGNPEH